MSQFSQLRANLDKSIGFCERLPNLAIAIAGYEELTGEFEPIRNGEIFSMNNNIHYGHFCLIRYDYYNPIILFPKGFQTHGFK